MTGGARSCKERSCFLSDYNAVWWKISAGKQLENGRFLSDYNVQMMGPTSRVVEEMTAFGSTLADQAPFVLPCSPPGEVMSLVKMTSPRGLTNPLACAGPDSDSDPAAEVVVWRLSCARFSLDLHIGGGYNTDCPSCSPGFGSPPDLDVDARSDVVYLAHRPIIGPNAPRYDPVIHGSSRSRSRSRSQIPQRSRRALPAPEA